MHVAETKTSSSANKCIQKKRQPFFKKEGQGSFFSKSAENATTFFSPTTIQPKLTIGKPGDKYEVEADAMADKVVQRLSKTEIVQTKPAKMAMGITSLLQPKCSECLSAEASAKEDEKEEQLQKMEQPLATDITPIQRKPIFESEGEFPGGEVQTKPLYKPSIQARCTDCEQEEALQKKEEEAFEEEAEFQAKLGFTSYPEPPEDKDNIQAKSGNLQNGTSDLENRLRSYKGGGRALAPELQNSMGSAFGSDLSNVRIHTGSNAVQMNKELNAQAFTHGNDIYFNEGKYRPETSSGKHLLAHELTHTVQQGNNTIRPENEKNSQRQSFLSVNENKVQKFDLPFGYETDFSWRGVKTAASVTASTVKKGAVFVKDKVVEGALWIYDRIVSVINSGKTYLNEKWESIQEFGRTCFDDIKSGFGNLIHFITTPLSGFKWALSGMNADLLGGVWNMLKTGANALWMGINSVINGILQFGKGIWNTVSGFINGIFDTIAGLFDNPAFDLLPDRIKEEVLSIFNGLRSLWNRISAFWTDLWQRLTIRIEEILTAVRAFVDNIISFSIGKVITMVRNLKEVYNYVTELFADPQATIQPFLDHIANKLNAEAPGQAKEIGTDLAHQNFPGGSAQKADHGAVQRVPSDSEDRTTATLSEVGNGILYYVAKAWAELDIKKILWETVVNMFWPPATIKAIFKQFSQLWNDDWATTVDSLYTPRNFFDDPLGCLHDVWSNFLILLDFPLALWRTLNNVVGLLMGYISIIIILVEAIGGAIAGVAAGGVGAIPGFLAGAAAGLGTVSALGEALMASYLAAESSTVVVILVRLFTARQICEKRQVDILTSVASFIVMAVVLILQILMALLAELVSLIANVIKGLSKGAPVPKPVPEPVPIPAEPVPAPAPGRVIPFPNRPVPVAPPAPVTPAEPLPIAAKFEEGVGQGPVAEILLEENKSTSLNKSNSNHSLTQHKETTSLSGVQTSANGILQAKETSRRSRIDPDACEPRKDICYERSVTFNINRTSMNFIGIQSTPDDLRIPGCVLRTALGTTAANFKSLNIAVGRFLVNGTMHYIPASNIPRGNIHSEDIILIEAKRRWGAGNYKLSALFSERVPCYRCSPNLRGTPLTSDARIYCIVNNDYDWRSIRRAYNDGRLI